VPKRGAHAGTPRLVLESSRYVAQYRDADGLHSVPTGCRDETAARGVLRELERRAELVKGNLLTRSEAQTADHQTAPLSEHFDAYDEHLRVHVNRKTGFPATDEHRRYRLAHLRRVSNQLGWTKLADLDRGQLEKWLAECDAAGMGARTRNTYAMSWTAFGNWCVDTHRLVANPLGRLPKANEQADRRRARRALSDAELARLFDAAQRRPLAEYGREVLALEPDPKHQKRANWTYAPVTPDNLAGCEKRAREHLKKEHPDRITEALEAGRLRALTYKALVLTGLRLNELRSLTVGAADLDGPAPFVVLRAADEKARRGAEIPLRADLVADLSRHLADRLQIAQRAAQRENRPIPARLPAEAPLLLMVSDAVRCLDRDLVAAGLAKAVRGRNRKGAECWRTDKSDERGRTFDMHAFRTTFNSLLAAAGVPLTARRILMRHAAEGVTDEHYTDPTLIDTRGALAKLPVLPLRWTDPNAENMAATGTDGKPDTDARFTVCRAVYSSADKPSTSGAIVDNSARNAGSSDSAVSGAADKSNERLSIGGQKRAMGFEPTTSSLGSWHSTTELRPQPYLSSLSGVTPRRQGPLPPAACHVSPDPEDRHGPPAQKIATRQRPGRSSRTSGLEGRHGQQPEDRYQRLRIPSRGPSAEAGSGVSPARTAFATPAAPTFPVPVALQVSRTHAAVVTANSILTVTGANALFTINAHSVDWTLH